MDIQGVWVCLEKFFKGKQIPFCKVKHCSQRALTVRVKVIGLSLRLHKLTGDAHKLKPESPSTETRDR